MELATHTPFVPQGVPPVSKPFELIASKAVRPPGSVERSDTASVESSHTSVVQNSGAS